MIIGKIHAHNFSAYICFAWFLYTLISPALHGNQQKITFLQLYQGSCNIQEKSTMKMLLMAFKYVAVPATSSKFKYRGKHLNTLSSCVNAPKHLPTEIILFCYCFPFTYFYPYKMLVHYIYLETSCF